MSHQSKDAQAGNEPASNALICSGKGGVSYASVPPVQMQVAQFVFEPTVATHHPVTGKPVNMNLLDNTGGLYMHKGAGAPDFTFFYRPASNEYYNAEKKPIAAPKEHDEDAAPQAPVASAENTFRGLKFTVDGSNRVTRAEGRIHQSGTAPETGRSGGAQTGAWEHVQSVYRSMFNSQKYFNGGHIIAHHLGGSPGTDNMVPMEKNYNQSGSYKQFEKNIDAQFDHANTSLKIRVDVTYATDYDDLMANIATDNGGKIAEIKADNNVSNMVMRTIGRIPKTITLQTLETIGLLPVSKAVASPASPMAPLKAKLRSPFSIQNILNTEFKQVKSGKDGKSSKVRKPFLKEYGPNKGTNIDVNKDYQADYMAIYDDMPRPGITNYAAGANGLAGGVDAYVWMDPMGMYDRFGGSETNDVVDPQGSRWAYFRDAGYPGGGKKIYKKGHLLNAGLHGPGADSRNLVPITTKANGDMSRAFEEPVKKSNALVDPRKGVIWKTRTGGAIARPLDWTQADAQHLDSEELWKEEAKIPAYIDCAAWEAIRFKSEYKKGRKIVEVRIWNKHPGDPDGQLRKTKSGDGANDTGIDASLVKSGNNNVQGHDAITHNVSAEAYKKGYEHNFGWLGTNNTPVNRKSFINGLSDLAYDFGFAGKDKPNLSALAPDLKNAFLKNYQLGRDNASYRQGYYHMAHSFKDDNDPRANKRYDDGSFFSGKDLGLALKKLPDEPWVNSTVKKGYASGLYNRGRHDAEDNLDPWDKWKNFKDYEDGYFNSLLDSAQDDGYEGRRYHAFGRSISRYRDLYFRGQYERGDDDGYNLDDRLSSQSQSYYEGYAKGSKDRGYEDGYDLERSGSDNSDYRNGYARGRYDIGYEDGRKQLDKRSGNPDYEDGWRKAMNDSGYHRGKQGGSQELPQSDYSKGWEQGIKEKGFDDGYYKSLPVSDHPLYKMAGYKGKLKRMYDDGYNKIEPHFTLYRIDSQDTQRAYQDGWYDRGKDDGTDLKPYNGNPDTPYGRGWYRGFTERAEQDGNDAMDPVLPNAGLYMRYFAPASYHRGRRDALSEDGMQLSQEENYLRGFHSVYRR